MRLISNKKGDVPSMIFAIIIIFIVGILFFFTNHMTDLLYTEMDDYFNSTATYNSSEARESVQDIQSAENELWDYGFLFIVFGIVLAMFLTAYSTRISIVFFWIYGVLSIVVIILAVMLSNLWQEMVANPEFSSTLLRFPITNLILGTYYPSFGLIIVLITIIALFGKTPDSSGGLI